LMMNIVKESPLLSGKEWHVKKSIEKSEKE
jgi:hypothetical protein